MLEFILLVLIFLIFMVFNVICLIFYNKFSKILEEKRSFTDFFFIGLFSVEQVIFLIAYFIYEDLSLLCVSLFAVIVVTTSTYQKFLMDIKIRKLGEYKINLSEKYKKLLNKYFRYRKRH